MNELEFEARSLISRTKYEELYSFYSREFPNHHLTDQKNIYLDTFNREIEKLANVLRIRSYADNRPSKLTYKIKRDEKSGDEEITQLIEKKDIIDILEKHTIPYGPVKKSLEIEGIDTKALHYFGEIKTNRFEIFNEEYVLVLDKNDYHGLTDYNIEIESSSKAKALEILKEICKQFDIKIEKDPTTKSQRAIAQYLRTK